MRLTWLVAVSLCATLAIGSLAARSPAGTGTVGGQVLDLNGRPVANAHVTLQATDGDQLQATETNTQGRFWFPFLSEGQYSVRASMRGAFPSGAKAFGSRLGTRPTLLCTSTAGKNRASDKLAHACRSSPKETSRSISLPSGHVNLEDSIRVKEAILLRLNPPVHNKR